MWIQRSVLGRHRAEYLGKGIRVSEYPERGAGNGDTFLAPEAEHTRQYQDINHCQPSRYNEVKSPFAVGQRGEVGRGKGRREGTETWKDSEQLGQIRFTRLQMMRVP